MATRRENMQELMRNSRSRTIIILTAAIFIIAIVVGLISLRSHMATSGAGAGVGGRAASQIESIPGELNPTEDYAKLVEKQNEARAKQALKSGGSAIPTLARSELFGKGKTLDELKGERGVGFTTLAREQSSGLGSQALWLEKLKKTGCSVAAVKDAADNGVSVAQMRDAGCTAEQLLAAGYNLAALKAAGFTAEELKAAGFTAEQLRAVGFTLDELRKAGFSACETKAAGFTADEMKAAGYSDGELRGAGINPASVSGANAIRLGSMTAADIKKNGCSPDAINRAMAAGVSPRALREIAGCTIQDMRAAGLGVGPIRAANFSPKEIRDAGFTAEEMRAAGMTDEELAAAGFTPEQIKASRGYGSYTVDQLKQMGCSPDAIRKARAAGVGAQAMRDVTGCGYAEMRAGGVTAADLHKAGFTAAQAKAAGFSDTDLIAAGFNAAQVASAGKGCSPDDIVKALSSGVSPKELRDVHGCTLQDMRAAGMTVSQARTANFTPAQLRAAGFTAAEMRAAGMTDSELAEAGFTPEEIAASRGYGSYTPSQLKAVDCSPDSIQKARAAGVTALALHDVSGCSFQKLRDGGMTADDFRRAGFTAQQAKAAGFSDSALLGGGFTPGQVRAASAERGFGTYSEGQVKTMGCSVDAIRKAIDAGVTLQAIADTAGCPARAMHAAGVTAAALKAAGFSVGQLREAGFSPNELKDAGFKAADLLAAGYSPMELKTAGFTPKELVEGGVQASALKSLGYNASQLKDAGVSPVDLVRAGFTPDELKAAGITASQLKAAGMTASELAKAGMSASDLRAGGFGTDELQAAGFSDDAIAKANADLAKLNGGIGLPGGGSASKMSPEQENQKRLEQVLANQAKVVSAQRLEQEIRGRQNAMQNKAGVYVSEWGSSPSQKMEFSKEDTSSSNKGQTSNANSNPFAVGAGKLNSSGGKDDKDKGPQVTVIRPGDVLFAILETGVNSDEPAPILATVISGKFKGARLIGSIALPDKGDKVIISFATMTLPGLDAAVPITAVAIDPFTARTALSSHTNKHTLARWGGLFASSFIQGLGQALQQSGSQTTIAGNGVVVTTTPAHTFRQSENIALAQVGQQFSGVIGQGFNRKPTVVVNSGISLGILFTASANVPIAEVTQTQLNRAAVGAIFG